MANASTLQHLSPELLRVVERAQREPEGRFHSLAHLLDVPALERAYRRMRKDAAVGVDGVTQEQYGQDLEANLRDLHARLKAKRYRHRPIRRVHTPKEGGKTRPIGISAFEDELVQDAVREVLEAIYERIRAHDRRMRSVVGGRSPMRLARFIGSVSLLTAFLSLGCGPKWPEIMQAADAAWAQARPEAETVISRVNAIVPLAAARPVRSVPPLDWGEGPPPLMESGAGASPNATLVTLAQLRGAPEAHEGLPPYYTPLQEVRSLLAGGLILEFATLTDVHSLEEAKTRVLAKLQPVFALRYLLVVRTYELIPPEIVRLDLDRQGDDPMGHFQPGLFRGDVLLYQIADGAFLGGAPIEATNSESVRVGGGFEFLLEDLGSRVRSQVLNALREVAGHGG